MYRDQRDRRPPRVVEYGHFPARRGRAAFGLLAIALGTVMLLALASSKELVCDRSITTRPACALTYSTLVGGRWMQFSPNAINEVRPGTRTGKGGRVTAHTVVLIDSWGAEHSLAWSDEAEAKKAHTLLDAFFAKGSNVPSVHVREQSSIWGILFAFGFMSIGLWVGIDALRGSGSWRIEVDLDAQRVTSRPSRFGWRGRALVHSLKGVHDVRLVRSTLRDRFKTRGQRDEPAARLVLVSKQAGELSLTTGLLRSSSPRLDALHENKRRELLAALDLSVDSAPEPPSESASTSDLRSRWQRLPKTTRSTIVFFASIIAIAAVGQTAVQLHAAETQGFLEVQCSRRCRFAFAECLPGGGFGMALDPGPYTLEVYDPRVPGNWQPLEITIVRGETVKLDCRPK